MKIKTITTIVLLAFVGVSVAFLVAKEAGWIGSQEAEAATVGPQTVVYYFHTNKRCDKCKTIEAYTKGVLDADFADRLANGRMVWRMVNLDEPANKHFEEEFELKFGTVVLAEKVNSDVQAFWRLDEVWKLTEDKPAFEAFVREEIRAFIKENE